MLCEMSLPMVESLSQNTRNRCLGHVCRRGTESTADLASFSDEEPQSPCKGVSVLRKTNSREVTAFAQQQVELFTYETIHSLLLENDVNEFAIKELLGCDKSHNSNKFTFQSFRKKVKEREGLGERSDDVITIV